MEMATVSEHLVPGLIFSVLLSLCASTDVWRSAQPQSRSGSLQSIIFEMTIILRRSLLIDPKPVGAAVPHFYGYYEEMGEKGEGKKAGGSEEDHSSTVLLLEDCGEPV